MAVWAVQTLVWSSFHPHDFSFHFSNETFENLRFPGLPCLPCCLFECGLVFEERKMEDCSSLFWTVLETGRPFSGELFSKGFLFWSCVLTPPVTWFAVVDIASRTRKGVFPPVFFCRFGFAKTVFSAADLRNDVAYFFRQDAFSSPSWVMFFYGTQTQQGFKVLCRHGSGISVYYAFGNSNILISVYLHSESPFSRILFCATQGPAGNLQAYISQLPA